MEVKDITSISDLATFCKETGFVFPSGDIYGGIAGFWDYGPLGVELRNNIKQLWWNRFVRYRRDVVGIDGAIITHPKVWKASGHVDGFNDLVTVCTKCKQQFRADHLIEDKLKIPADGFSAKKIDSLIAKHKLTCSACKKGKLSETKTFSLMFKTYIGPIQDEKSTAYLRPETAQLIFPNFGNVLDTSRVKLPFGIAQIGRSFRNEISPRNFIFRDREIEQMEIEYFVHPDSIKDCPFFDSVKNIKFKFLSSEIQKKKSNAKLISAEQLAKKSKLPWLVYWTAKIYDWYINELGMDPENFRIREHMDEELAHYASGCYDIEYKYPFGWKEMNGIADRGDYDLSKHNKYSGKRLKVYDEEKKEWITPFVAAEPSLGVERVFMTLLLDAFTVEKIKSEDRRVLKLAPKVAPIQVAIFPLMKKDELKDKANELYDVLKETYVCQYDEAGSIGKRYRRMDEVGTPYCITVDYDTLKDKAVTVRDRDTMKQKRVKIKDLHKALTF
jgi:glycyl-tRNA synthetase